MLEFQVAPGDQSVYEITTDSGKKYLVRCPGVKSTDLRCGALMAFLIGNACEQPVMLRDLDKIVSFTKREDLTSNDPRRPERMGDLLWTGKGKDPVAIRSVHLS